MADVTLIAPLHGLTGYANAGRGTLAALLSAGLSVAAVETDVIKRTGRGKDGDITSVNFPRYAQFSRPAVQDSELSAAINTPHSPGSPVIVLHSPEALSDFPEYSDGPRIGYTMCESNSVIDMWARRTLNCERLVVPTKYCQKAFQYSVPAYGFVNPVSVVPLCVDERVWTPDGPKAEVSNRPETLLFAVCGHADRKHYYELLQAFAEEFRGESSRFGLLVKCDKFNKHILESMAGDCRKMGAWVNVIDALTDSVQQAALYRECDGFLSLGVEGFGMPAAEAMMCGTPAAVLDAGGTADFVDAGIAAPLSKRPEHHRYCRGTLPSVYRSGMTRPAAPVQETRSYLRQFCEWLQESEGRRHGAKLTELVRAYCGRKMVGIRLAEVIDSVKTLKRFSIPAELSPAQTRRFTRAAFVITTFNKLEHTKKAVASILDNIPSAEIVIADDGSTDGTRDWAYCTGLHVINCAGGNVSNNRQKAQEYLREKYGNKDNWLRPLLVFMDNDIELGPDFLSGVTRVLESCPFVGILSTRKIYPDGELQNIGSFIAMDGSSYQGTLDKELVFCDYVESALLIAVPEVWGIINWRSEFPIFYEDVAYCYDMRKRTSLAVCATNAVTVIHDAHTTSAERAEEAAINRDTFLRLYKEFV